MTNRALHLVFIGGALALLLAACQAQAPRPQDKPLVCHPPTGHDLMVAMDDARNDLARGCAGNFDAYVGALLTIAEGDPKPRNRQIFSEFFVWAADQGLISRKQAGNYYNRYFNVKFMSLAGDYNNCSLTCPNKLRVLDAMDKELLDKELGMLKVAKDQDGYHRAARLVQEAELVLEATCQACASSL
ncbi:MAG: hypothetical protein KDH88_04910 [Chromatiales bacterium]|nr:hypothetical protein [Chromatiales bacterium]